MKCPKWFQIISLIIVHNGQGKVLLGKRKEGKVEGGKWAILGGSGAFPESESAWHFAVRELTYDVSMIIYPQNLKRFQTEVFGDSRAKLILTDLFVYDSSGEPVYANEFNPEAPINVKWFSLEEIRKMDERGEIAFDNAKTLEKFFESVGRAA